MGERLQTKQAEADEAGRRRAEALIPKLRDRIERDPADFVANPGGRITLTEFYDYRCPHCANAAPKVLDLIRRRPDVRVVFKESPIFGAVSEHAARAALAVRQAGGDSLGFYQTLMTAHGLDDAAIDRIALQKGARPADLKPGGTPAQNAQLQRNAALFSELDLQGTPAFIVGDRIILGEDMGAVEAAVSGSPAKGS